MVYCKGNVFFPKNQTFCPKSMSYGGVMGDSGSVTLLPWGVGQTGNRPFGPKTDPIGHPLVDLLTR